VLLSTAIVNLFTKSVATVSGIVFAAAFFIIFTVSERAEPAQARPDRAADEGSLPTGAPGHGEPGVGGHPPRRRHGDHARRRQSPGAEVDLARTSTEDQDVVVISVRMMGVGGPEYLSAEEQSFSEHEQMIFTKAVSVAESFGKKVSLLWFPPAMSSPRWRRAQTRWRWIRWSPESPVHDRRGPGISSGTGLGGAARAQAPVQLLCHRPNGEVKVFYIGPHAPKLSPDDVQLVHRLWLNMRRDPSVQELHHSDIITYAF
jgi:hypothetical protein